jgi:MFS family permease
MRGKGFILAALCLAALIINLDTTIVNVALPALVRQIGATTIGLQWVVDAYNLVFAALILAAGSLADRLGRKGMLLAGLAVFGAASLAGAFAATTGQLIAARAVMGLGAAMMFPATLSLLTNVFTARKERALAIGVWGPAPGSGSRWARSPAAGCWSGSGGAASSCSWFPSRQWSGCWSPGVCPPPGTRAPRRWTGGALPCPRPG